MKKWLKLLIPCALMFVGAVGMTACSSAPAKVDESAEVVESEQPQENFIKKSYETYVVPLFAGVSLSGVGSAVFAVLFTYFKERSRTKQFNARNKELKDREESIAKKEEQINEALVSINEILKEVKKANIDSAQTSKFIETKVEEIENTIKGNAKSVEKIDKVEKMVCLCTELLVKVAKCSNEVVKSGLINDVERLAQMLKEI